MSLPPKTAFAPTARDSRDESEYAKQGNTIFVEFLHCQNANLVRRFFRIAKIIDFFQNF